MAHDASKCGGYVGLLRIKPPHLALQQTMICGSWSVEAAKGEVTLTGLERGVDDEFRVFAVNSAGDSVTSNSASAVL